MTNPKIKWHYSPVMLQVTDDAGQPYTFSPDSEVLSRANHTGTQDVSTITGLGSAATKDVGVADGVAPLDATGKLSSAYLPALSLTDVNVIASETEQLALAAQEGDVAVRSDISTSYIHNGGTAGTMGDWQELLASVVDHDVLKTNGGAPIVCAIPTGLGATTANGGYEASGDYSHAEGWGTRATGNASHAEGAATSATGDRSHAEGDATTASGFYSHAEGSETIANGFSSHAEGYWTTAYGAYVHIQGANGSTGTSSSPLTIHGQAFGAMGDDVPGSSDKGLVFSIDSSGNGRFDGTTNVGAADYAEMFQSADGLAIAPGVFVCFDETYPDRVRVANSGDAALGIISPAPGVVGDAASNSWAGKYLADDFGVYLLEPDLDPDGYETGHTRRVLNPDNDPSLDYVRRVHRPDWQTVGLLGKLWVLTDHDNIVPGQRVTVGDGGKAIPASVGGWHVMATKTSNEHGRMLRLFFTGGAQADIK